MKALLATTLIALGVSAAPASPPVFTDVTAASGIKFRHVNGAFGKKFLPETLGSGCAFLDYDNDGWQDILLINSTHFPSQAGAAGYPALYHNNKNGTFTDVTREAGLAVEMYGMGVAAADYDNDGNVDVYVTALGQNRLFRNQGGGKFKDVSAAAGVAHEGFSTGAMWLDYDRDGHLDLFVADYVEWTAANDLFCSLDGKSKSYCTPESYKGRSPTLYHNRGNGTFEDVTKKAGLLDPASKALGVALIDVDDDGWPDIFVANDTQPNRLYRNRRDGTFQDMGMTAGVAFNEAGVARAGMGVDAADIDGSGRQTLVIGNFSNEMMSLYVNDGKGLFIDEAPSSGIGRASLLTLTFACFFFDYDLDGMPDIFAANGHVADDINTVQPKITYAQPAHLFRNAGKRRFEEVTAKSGAALQQRVVARGAAYADIDNDGDLDLLVTANNGPARLLRNDGGNRSKMLRMKLIGSASNRDAIGSKVRITAADGSILRGMVKTGSSYCSQSELTLTFGLGSAAAVKAIEVTWPNGKVETLPGADASQTITVQEGKGIIARAPVRQTS
jgi:enediyne biosynthesis protein E4